MSSDAWDDEPATAIAPASRTGTKPKIIKVNPIPDDWELDDDEEEGPGRSVDAQNKRLWEEANSKEFRPMPAVIISRGASASNTPSSLPLNQPPTMRILKRPSPSASPSQSSTNVNGSESLQDREARYQAARERIFGPSSPSAGSNDKMPKVSSPTPPPLEATKIVREPRGPDSSGDNGTGQRHDGKGFRERKIKPPPPSSASSPLVQPGPS